MDKESIAAIAARGEQIKTNSAEYLWLCRGIRPPLLSDKPVVTDPNVNSEDQHLRRLNCAAPVTRRRI
jgi:hypothetical protein